MARYYWNGNLGIVTFDRIGSRVRVALITQPFSFAPIVTLVVVKDSSGAD